MIAWPDNPALKGGCTHQRIETWRPISVEDDENGPPDSRVTGHGTASTADAMVTLALLTWIG